MSVKRWLFLPFLGGADKRDERHHESGRDRRKFQGDDGMIDKHESAADFANKNEEELVRDYNAPITWYFIATLFPLIAGTFGPMASAFNVCAVAIDWRLVIDSDSSEAEGQHIADPTWLVAVNAVSLAIAIIANLALLLHMTGRIRFNIGAPIVIVGWYTAGFIDIALVAAAPTYLPLPPNPLATWSQAYYYAIFSGAIYVLLSIMLSVTAWAVWIGRYSSEFKLSLAQRSLMLQTMLFLGYILAAAEVFSYIEGWLYLDGKLPVDSRPGAKPALTWYLPQCRCLLHNHHAIHHWLRGLCAEDAPWKKSLLPNGHWRHHIRRSHHSQHQNSRTGVCERQG